MKNKKSIWWIVMIIIATVVTSCRYQTGSRVSNEYLSGITWQEMPDSIKIVLNQVLDSLGPKRLYTEIHTGEVILLSKIEGSRLPDTVISRIPFYLTMKFGDDGPLPLIVQKETKTGAGKSWIRNDQIIFSLILIDQDFRTGTVSIEETAFDVWIILVAILIISCLAALYYNKNYDRKDERIRISAFVAVICLLFLWLTVAYLISTLATIISLIFFIYSFIKK